jgi:hypothetical protein
MVAFILCHIFLLRYIYRLLLSVYSYMVIFYDLSRVLWLRWFCYVLKVTEVNHDLADRRCCVFFVKSQENSLYMI